MDSILSSCLSLAKSNNGLFKSEKQARFLTRVLSIDNNFGCTHSFGVHSSNNHQMIYTVHHDEKGIIEIEQYSHKTGKTKIKFKRATEQEWKAKQDKKLQDACHDAMNTLNSVKSSINKCREEIRKEIKSYKCNMTAVMSLDKPPKGDQIEQVRDIFINPVRLALKSYKEYKAYYFERLERYSDILTNKPF